VSGYARPSRRRRATRQGAIQADSMTTSAAGPALADRRAKRWAVHREGQEPADPSRNSKTGRFDESGLGALEQTVLGPTRARTHRRRSARARRRGSPPGSALSQTSMLGSTDANKSLCFSMLTASPPDDTLWVFGFAWFTCLGISRAGFVTNSSDVRLSRCLAPRSGAKQYSPSVEPRHDARRSEAEPRQEKGRG
jgi:hypothetical protein